MSGQSNQQRELCGFLYIQFNISCTWDKAHNRAQHEGFSVLILGFVDLHVNEFLKTL